MTKVALVIGADKGIGADISRTLCENFNDKVYLTYEGSDRGQLAADTLTKEGYNVHILHLDITSVESIVKARTRIQEAGDSIDLLINNSATVETCSGSGADRIRRALNENFYGNLNVGKLIHPLLRDGARVVLVTAASGLLSAVPGESVRARLGDPSLTEDELVELMQQYERAAEAGAECTEGWDHRPGVVVSVALSALTFVQQRELTERNISVVCVNSGYDKRHGSRRSENARTVINVALDASNVGGMFIWSDCREVNWRLFVETQL